jgi:hypothetical protein
VALASGEPNGHSLETTRLPPGAIARSRGLSSGSLTSRGMRSLRLWSNTTIVLSPSPEGPRPEDRYSSPSAPKPKPRGNGTLPSGQEGLAFSVEARRQGQDRAAMPERDAVAAVRRERPPARVKALGAARVQNDRPLLVDREDAVIAAGDIRQITGRAQAQAARISDPAVLAERPGQLPIGGKHKSAP